MQILTIIGNICQEPTSKTTNSGKNVCTFTVAVNRVQRDQNGQNIADFFRVAAWGALGENCQKYLAKGRKVAVVGTVSAHAYQKQDGTAGASLEVFAQNVEFLTPKGDSASAPAQEAPAMTDVSGDIGSELPF